MTWTQHSNPSQDDVGGRVHMVMFSLRCRGWTCSHSHLLPQMTRVDVFTESCSPSDDVGGRVHIVMSSPRWRGWTCSQLVTWASWAANTVTVWTRPPDSVLYWTKSQPLLASGAGSRTGLLLPCNTSGPMVRHTRLSPLRVPLDGSHVTRFTNQM